MIEIKGFENYTVTRDGKVINTNTGRVLKPDVNNCGYLRVTLSKNGKTYRFFIHHLVALHYVPNPLMAKQVNHKDGIKFNNEDTNLEWCSASENINHAYNIGLKGLGQRHHNSTISDDVAKDVCGLIEDGYARSYIMSETGASKHQVDDIRRRKTWAHISKDYNW